MRKVSTLVGLSLFALAGTVSAQEAAPAADMAAPPAGDAAAAPAPAPEAAPAPAPAGTDYVSRGLTQTAGNLQVTVPIVLNLSKEMVLKPVWVPLDVRYGVTDQLEVFLSHSLQGGSFASGSGLCLGSKERGCLNGKLESSPYNNVAIGGQFSFLKDNGLELTGFGALDVRSLSPMYLAIDVGVGFKYNSGPIAIKAAPQIGIGATKRSEGNKEKIAVPVQIAFQATPELAAFVNSGISGPTEKFGDNYVVPVGVGASFAAMPNLDVGGEFMLPMVLTGEKDDKAMDARYLMVFAQWRMK